MKSFHFSLWLMVGIGLVSAIPVSSHDVREFTGIDTVILDNGVYDEKPDTLVIDVVHKGDPDSDPSNLPVDSLYNYYRKRHHEQDSIESQTEDVHFNLQMLVRSYGDSIVIRWAPDEYVPWRFLNGKGVYLIRYEPELQKAGEDDDEEEEVEALAGDTIALLKPLNKYEFAKLFSDTDTMAFAAMQTIFGEGTTLDNTRSAPGSAGSIMEVYEEQQNVFGMAMVIAERRRDIATAMGLRFVDKNVKPGATYNYFLTPNLSSDVLKIIPALVNLENKPYEPKPCTLELEDSIAAVDGILLSWPYTDDYSSFDIERRKQGQKDWVVLNKKPYMSMTMDLFEDENPPSLFADTNMEPGTYTYRLRGYDSFGDKSAPGPEHEVTLPDLIPPVPPRIKLITINRGDSTITARIDWTKEAIEPDLLGYIPFYQFGSPEDVDNLEYQATVNTADSALYGGRWVPLVKDRVLAPRDSSVLVDVRGLNTGMVTIAAVDSAMNMTYAMPMPMRIDDLEPPLPPTNLRGLVSAEGVVTIGWTPSISRDAYYYEVFSANDTTHTFVLVPNQQMHQDTLFNDTLSLEVNHPYKYYKVRAIDWAGNNSEFTQPLRVMRPNFNPPSECFIDTSWVTTDSIYMRWVISPEKDLDKVRVFRRLSNESQWTMIRTYYHEDVNGKPTLEVIDRPTPNQTIRYYYAIEAINMTGVSTGLSMQVCYLFQGQRVFDVPLKLDASWREDKGYVILAWDAPERLPITADYHFVLSRQLEGENFFRPYRSIRRDKNSFEDRRMKPGESTVYRLEILFEDGRRTTPSNEVKITIPKKKE